jgi:hypothetical protein
MQQTTTNISPAPLGLTRGFMAIVLFFLVLLIVEVLSGETWGITTQRRERPQTYWTVVAFQAGAGILFVAVLYFLTH